MLKNWSPDNKPKGISCSKSSAHCVTLASAGGLFQNMLIQSVNYFYFGSLHFYRAMLRRARYCYGKLSVCP